MSTENPVAGYLPRWQCHKQVWADQIVEARDWLANDPQDTHYPASEKDTGIRLVLASKAFIIVHKDLIARGCPTVGDYYMQYDDGYESWSPATVFEEGYTRL